MSGDSFDEEHIDPHGECAAEIKRLRDSNAELCAALKSMLDAIAAANDYDDLLIFANNSGWAAAHCNPACDLARAALAKAVKP